MCTFEPNGEKIGQGLWCKANWHTRSEPFCFPTQSQRSYCIQRPGGFPRLWSSGVMCPYRESPMFCWESDWSPMTILSKVYHFLWGIFWNRFVTKSHYWKPGAEVSLSAKHWINDLEHEGNSFESLQVMIIKDCPFKSFLGFWSYSWQDAALYW